MFSKDSDYICCRQAKKGDLWEALITTCRGLTEEGSSLCFLKERFNGCLILQNAGEGTTLFVEQENL